MDISTIRWVRLIAVNETPDNLVQYNNKVVGVPPDAAQPLSDDPDSPSLLWDIWGYLRPPTAPNTEPEFVMTERIGRALRQALNDVPGVGGWNVVESRRIFRQAARQLVERGMSRQQVVTFLQELYQAAAAERVTRPVP